MPETESLPQQVKEQIETIGRADVVIGLPSFRTSEDLAWAAKSGFAGLHVLIAYPSSGEVIEPDRFPAGHLVRYPISAPDRYLSGPTSIYGSFHEVLQISQRAGSKACCVWNSAPQGASLDTIEQMLRPVLDQSFDLVFPSYIEAKLGALVNSSIICPMTRALYGRQIHFPMAVDLGFSSQFVDRLLQTDPQTRQLRSTQWIASEAISAGLPVCQVSLPMEIPRPPDSTDLSSILATILGRLFADLERNTSFWQRSSGSQLVPTFGTPGTRDEDEVAPVDVQRMIDTFQLGYRNLAEIWGVALPPGTLVALKKLTKMTMSEFRMADDLWVRVVYDFALAHRQRAINREHLLRAMTPLYLAWVASYALETKDRSITDFQNRLERLALAYESQKPYLLSRWRWPDRFNP
jgi:glucosylglycerate synthase